jgi:hypothetical protein
MTETNQPQGHLLFVNATTWCSTGREYSVADAAKIMEKEKLTYFVYYVPLPADAQYEIDFYRPMVKGAYPLEMVEFKNGRKVKAKSTKE